MAPDMLVKKARRMGVPIYVCPVDGRCIIGHASERDDKVMCGCGEPNPSLPKGMRNVEARTHVHYKEGLERLA